MKFPRKSSSLIPDLRLLALLWLMISIFGGAGALAQTVFLDVNTAGQYTNNFNPWNDNGGIDGGNYAFAESASAGVGGGRGVARAQSTDTTTTYKSSSWDFSTNGATFFLSIMLKANALTDRMQFGIMNTNYNGLNNNAGVAFETFRLFPTSAMVWSVREQYRSANLIVETNINSVTVVAGRWYKFVVGFTNTAGALGSYSSGCALYDFGVDGLTPGTNLITFATAQKPYRPNGPYHTKRLGFPARRGQCRHRWLGQFCSLYHQQQTGYHASAGQHHGGHR
jgi:hypothetical protein